MEIDVDELLQFCAYYQISKHASKLTIQTAPQQLSQPEPPKPKLQKTTRRKIEVVDKKPEKVEKVVKPKMEVVPKKPKNQPIPTKPDRAERVQRRQGEDLTYFMSHMSGHTHDRQKGYGQIFNNNDKDYEVYSRTPAEYSSKNYDTFGRSNQNYQYETYQSKMQKQNVLYSRGNLTERPPQVKNYMQKSYLATDPKQSAPTYDPYMETSKTKKFWQNTVYQTRRMDKVDFGNLMYSPVRRDNPSPSHSFISEMQDRSVSKSKIKLKRKNSERPFYNASQLAPKERENQTRARKNQYEPSVLSNSFISTEEMRVTNNKKQFDDDGRRETSTTSYAPKNGREGKTSVRRDPLQNDLDDGIGDMINQISIEQRNAPIAISLVSREAKF